MSKFYLNDETEVEKRLIEVLGDGYNQWKYRSDLKSEQDLWNNLRKKITHNNLSEIGENPLTDNEFEKIKVELLSNTNTPFDVARWLKGENGIARISIERDDIALGRVSLILYSNQDIGGGISSYEVVNQIAKAKLNEESRDRRFDVTLLINGLPIIQIELKQIHAKDGIYQAFNQIKKYSEEGVFRNNIFSTLQIFVVSNEQTTRYFANSLPKDMQRKFLFSWRTKDNKKVDNLYEFSKQVLNIPDAHRLIANYTIISEEQNQKNLMVLHPYQIHAIEALFTAANKHQSGYVWHATGSGKTLTSFVSTKLLARKSGIDRTIMLVDRKDLDNQTTNEFTKFASEFNTGLSIGNAKNNSLIVGTGNSTELRDVLLSDANSNVVIITTRQKLEAALESARKQEIEKGTNRFQKLLSQHIVFIVDECHRALSSEGMEEVKKFFPNSTWFGFTGTPIKEVNKKQAKGKLARTTHDQYGEVLHTYTIKNALDDGSVLGFQVEHENTLQTESLDNKIFRTLQSKGKFKNNDEINKFIDQMEGIEKETYIDDSIYESKEHIEKVIEKIFRPDNAYVKFDFENGRPTKSAILTTNSIKMAKKYYNEIKKMKNDDKWIEKKYENHPIRMGRTIEDKDFPRVAITYSLEENDEQAASKQDEMQNIIDDYNLYYGTTWSISEIERYNGDINNRLARKKAEYKQFGNQIDLVIVVNRLLTGFDAPQVLTLFVDKNLEYANLIQAFSRTNRTFRGKEKGLVVTFRKPFTMEYNVEEATKTYSKTEKESGLVYPTYEESKTKFEDAFKKLDQFIIVDVDEHTDDKTKIDYVKTFQEFQNAYEALVTYDKFNDEYESSKDLRNKVLVIEEQVGIYNTLKGSLKVKVEENNNAGDNLLEIEFYSENQIKLYDIDSNYINQLLDSYSANNTSIRNEIEKALANLNKVQCVKDVYNDILNEIDKNTLPENEDIFVIKRKYFSQARSDVINQFAKEWLVDVESLFTSAMQYTVGIDTIPNIGDIIDSKDDMGYKKLYPNSKPFQYAQNIKRAWKGTLDDFVVPYDDELK